MSRSKITRRRVIQGAATVAAASFILDFVPQAKAYSWPNYTVNLLLTPPTNLQNGAVPVIGPNFIGLSYDKVVINSGAYTDGTTVRRLLDAANTTLINFLQSANVQVIRLADGSYNDWADGTGIQVLDNLNPPHTNSAGMTPPLFEQGDVNALALFLKAAKCQCLYGVNLGGTQLAGPNTSYDTTLSPPEDDDNGNVAAYTDPCGSWAANELSYVSSKLGTSLFGAEVGNESNDYAGYVTWPNGNTFPGFYTTYSVGTNPCGITAPSQNAWIQSSTKGPEQESFTLLWDAFSASITAATPGIAMTGPTFDGGNDDPPTTTNTNWSLGEFANHEGSKLKLLTQHYYLSENTAACWTGTANAPGLFTPFPNPQLKTIVSYLQSDTGGNNNNAPAFRITECNSFWGGGGNTGNIGNPVINSNLYGTALWALDFMFTCAEYNCQGVNSHCGGIYQTLYNPLPFNFNGSKSLGMYPAPLFYGITFFNQVGQGTFTQVSPQAPGNLTTVFCIQTSSKKFAVVVNNKDTTECTVDLQLPSGVTASNCETWSLTSSNQQWSDPYTDVYIQGVQFNSTAGVFDGTIDIPISGTPITPIRKAT
jgi:hypothetical protein